MLDQILAIFRDIPGFLDGFIASYGLWVYVLLFAIIFVETGLVIMPFLPGDSLLFTVGALAARPDAKLNVWLITIVLIIAAVLGDAVNYYLGKKIGPRVFNRAPSEKGGTLFERLLNRQHLDKAHAFFDKYGGKAVVLGRFVPIVRTFVPFVAGAGAMNYRQFVWFNITGAILWVGVCVAAGWFFGNIAFVQKNFEAVVIGIIVISLIPIGIEWIIARKAAKKAAIAAPAASGAVVTDKSPPSSEATKP